MTILLPMGPIQIKAKQHRSSIACQFFIVASTKILPMRHLRQIDEPASIIRLLRNDTLNMWNPPVDMAGHNVH